MAEVKIYTSSLCGYCYMAKNLLRQKNVEFQEISVDNHPELRKEMEELSQRLTVPQIFINDQPIGGCDDLEALNRNGELDRLLAASS